MGCAAVVVLLVLLNLANKNTRPPWKRTHEGGTYNLFTRRDIIHWSIICGWGTIFMGVIIHWADIFTPTANVIYVK